MTAILIASDTHVAGFLARPIGYCSQRRGSPSAHC